MAMTVTLKNIPDDIYERLRRAAEAHHRSINGEAIACLEQVLAPARVGNEAHLARARQVREELQGQRFKANDIRKAIEQGRP